MTKTAIFMAAGFLLSAQPSATDYMNMCGLSIETGMDQDVVLREAKRRCEVKLQGSPRTPDAGVEIWDLSTKGRTPLPVGSVSFDGHEKVIGIHKGIIYLTSCRFRLTLFVQTAIVET